MNENERTGNGAGETLAKEGWDGKVEAGRERKENDGDVLDGQREE